MTPTHINAIIDHHLDGWLGSGPSSESNRTLRIRIADMIREALKLKDKQWGDGQMTLRHELQQAQDTIDTLRGVVWPASRRCELRQMNRQEYDTLKSMGLLWELYPDAPDTFEGIDAPHA